MGQDQRSVLTEIQNLIGVQIAEIADVSSRLDTAVVELVDHLLNLEGKLVITGLGKSGLIGQKLAATFASTGTSAFFVNSSEALHGDLGMVSKGDAVLMISNSGATPELVKMLPSLRHIGVDVYGMFGNTDTALAKECDLTVNFGVKQESGHLGLAPTCSSTAMLVLGDAIACTLMRIRGFSADDFAIYHPGGTIGRRLLLRAKDVMHRGAEIPTVSPTATLKDAAIEMTRSPLGAVCVCDADKRLVGLLTDGDFRRLLISSDDLSIPVHGCMTTNPRSAGPNDTLDHLIDLMETPGQQVYSLPILDQQQRLVGFVRMHDLLSKDQ